ncbi:MAG: hypothetical protein LWW83_16535 [Azonexaceae bacterium]|nr:hypothetical protein [Azonexaceae bacterium]
MNPQAAYGLLAHGLIFGALLSLLPLGTLRPRAGLAGTAIALLAGIAPAMHAAFGPPSMTLLCLALLRLIPQPVNLLGPRLALGLCAAAALLYPTSAGWGGIDLHALGYQPRALGAALLPLGAALWLRGQVFWLLILAVDLAAYAAGLFDNLWDALVDPLLILVAAIVVARHAAGRLIGRWRQRRAA